MTPIQRTSSVLPGRRFFRGRGTIRFKDASKTKIAKFRFEALLFVCRGKKTCCIYSFCCGLRIQRKSDTKIDRRSGRTGCRSSGRRGEGRESLAGTPDACSPENGRSGAETVPAGRRRFALNFNGCSFPGFFRFGKLASDFFDKPERMFVSSRKMSDQPFFYSGEPDDAAARAEVECLFVSASSLSAVANVASDTAGMRLLPVRRLPPEKPFPCNARTSA